MKNIITTFLLCLTFLANAQTGGQIKFAVQPCLYDSVQVTTVTDADYPSDHDANFGYLYRTNPSSSYEWLLSNSDTVLLPPPLVNYIEVIKVTTAFNYQGSQYVLNTVPIIAVPTSCVSSNIDILDNSITCVPYAYVRVDGKITDIEPEHGLFVELRVCRPPTKRFKP